MLVPITYNLRSLFVRKTSLLLTAAITARSDVFIGTDSGPAHMAAYVGTPVVVLFGPADPNKYRPLSPRVIVMQPHAACDPRCDKTCARPATHCMLDHTVEAVVAAAQNLLDQTAAAATHAALGASSDDPDRT